MSKMIVDYFYDKCPYSEYLRIESVIYVEDGRQYLEKNLIEIDPEELERNYYSVLDDTYGNAQWNFRPVQILKVYSQTLEEMTDEKELDYWGDYRDKTPEQLKSNGAYNHAEWAEKERQWCRDMEEWAKEHVN